MFVKALDFVRLKNIQELQAYHHIGIYAFTNKALSRYVGLKRSKLELERKLEQLKSYGKWNVYTCWLYQFITFKCRY